MTSSSLCFAPHVRLLRHMLEKTGMQVCRGGGTVVVRPQDKWASRQPTTNSKSDALPVVVCSHAIQGLARVLQTKTENPSMHVAVSSRPHSRVPCGHGGGSHRCRGQMPVQVHAVATSASGHGVDQVRFVHSIITARPLRAASWGRGWPPGVMELLLPSRAGGHTHRSWLPQSLQSRLRRLNTPTVAMQDGATAAP